RGDRTRRRRYVLYVPRTRETYSLQLAPGADATNTLRATWSPNFKNKSAEAFRLALRRRAVAAPPRIL
ncbi:MAG: hypothetical protein WCD76_14890, partial [Pyrinomonadaceae bacterium]